MQLLSDSQLQTLRAMIDRLIPADEDPGALEAGVETYILRQLETDNRESRPMIERGLDLLAERSFAFLDESAKDALLHKFETNEHRDFFWKMVQLTGEGFYADPGNGGNRDMISWKMIGYEITDGQQTP